MYALASGMVGFRSSTLRVRVTDRRDGCVWVITADLLDAGTRLVLNPSQVTPEPAMSAADYVHASQNQWIALNPGWTPRPIDGEADVVRHVDGLVSLEGR